MKGVNFYVAGERHCAKNIVLSKIARRALSRVAHQLGGAPSSMTTIPLEKIARPGVIFLSVRYILLESTVPGKFVLAFGAHYRVIAVAITIGP